MMCNDGQSGPKIEGGAQSAKPRGWPQLGSRLAELLVWCRRSVDREGGLRWLPWEIKVVVEPWESVVLVS